MNRRFSTLLLAALCAGATRIALAQLAPQPLQAPQLTDGKTKKQRFLRLKNVTPGVMAWWLDPQHHEAPPEFAGVKSSPSDPTQKGILSLPEGIEIIVAIDPQKALLVFGTEAGFEELQKIVGFLDLPQRQVEIEAQLLQIKSEDMADFDFGNDKSVTGKGSPLTGFLRGDFQATIAKLTAQNKVEIFLAPRHTIFNNRQADIATFGAAPNIATAKKISQDLTQLPQGPGYKNLFLPFIDRDTIQVVTPLKRMSGFRLLVTPTINNDDTLSLAMSTGTTVNTIGGSPLKTDGDSINSIVHVRDGDTVAIALFSTRFKYRATTDKILLVTPRIVRHANEDVSTAAKP